LDPAQVFTGVSGGQFPWGSDGIATH